MSAIASFYLMPKNKFQEYCAMAHLFPRSQCQRTLAELRVVTRAEMKTPEFRNRQQYYDKLWKFLQANSKEPYDYNWSGYVFTTLFDYLKQQRGLDFEDTIMVSEDSEIYVFDSASKAKYVQQLAPSNFNEEELKQFYVEDNERSTARMLKVMAANMPKEKLQQMMGGQNASEDSFPEAGKAMMDGVQIMHQCLQLVDDESIVFLTIG